MKAKRLTAEIDKARRFLPADLDEVEVLISKNNNGISFYFIKEEQILHKFTMKED